MKAFRWIYGVTAVAAIAAAQPVLATSVSGDPAADGWYYHGNSLAQGNYVRGTGNYAFDMYSAAFELQAGSNLIVSHDVGGVDYSWLAGDSIVAVGGVFRDIDNAEAGWTIDGALAQLPTTGNKPALQVKFGTDSAIFSASGTPPKSGDGNGSTSQGGTGVVFMKTSGSNWSSVISGDPPYHSWEDDAGQPWFLSKDADLAPSNLTDDRFWGQMIWTWDDQNNQVASWQLLLNTSLLNRINPLPGNEIPQVGNMAILSINGSGYTDALVEIQPWEFATQTVVPEPASAALGLMGLAGLAMAARRRRA